MLTDEQRKKIRAAATAAGADPDEAEKLGETLTGQKTRAADDEPGAKPATSAEPHKVFQYHLPFLTVSEVRSLIGFAAPVVDGDMLTGPWLVKHGGGQSTPQSTPAQ